MTHDDTDDRALVARVQGGEADAFGGIVTRYKHPILDFAYRMTGDPDEAADVAQDVFVRAWRALPRFRPRADAAFSTWLFQIARHACIDRARRRARDPLRAVTDDEGALDRVPAAGSVHRELAGHELGVAVAAAVGALPEDQRTALVLAEYEGLSHADIAAAMQCSLKSVEARLYRARQTLRERLSGWRGT